MSTRLLPPPPFPAPLRSALTRVSRCLRASLAFCCFFSLQPSAFSLSATPYISELAAPGRDDRAAVLIAHGVNTTPEALLSFLRDGFTDAALSRGLPKEPAVKTDVVNAAIQELGFQEAGAAAPTLAALVSGELTPGLRAILQRDVEPYPVSEEDRRRAELMDFVRHNAIVALGLIGDPAGIAAVRALMGGETRPPLLAESAIALGLMGDGEGLRRLSQSKWDATEGGQVALFGAVYLITGRNYGVTENSSLARRRQAGDAFRAWHAQQGGAFVPDRREILRRRLAGVEQADLPVDSLRGALRASRRFDDFDRRFAARQRLQTLAPASVAELKAIVLDELEDVDIRTAAMDWYAATAPQEARKTIRSLRSDENPPVRARATMLADDIERALARDK